MVKRLKKWLRGLRDAGLCVVLLVGLPLALLICLTFPFWFFALTIFCAYMAGSSHASR